MRGKGTEREDEQESVCTREGRGAERVWVQERKSEEERREDQREGEGGRERSSERLREQVRGGESDKAKPGRERTCE